MRAMHKTGGRLLIAFILLLRIDLSLLFLIVGSCYKALAMFLRLWPLKNFAFAKMSLLLDEFA